MTTRHALYAVTADGLAFRVGQPCDWETAQQRWSRVDDRRIGANGYTPRAIHVRHDGRRYRIIALEVRAVDRVGRGLGSDRHTLAFPVPYRAMRTALAA